MPGTDKRKIVEKWGAGANTIAKTWFVVII